MSNHWFFFVEPELVVARVGLLMRETTIAFGSVLLQV